MKRLFDVLMSLMLLILLALPMLIVTIAVYLTSPGPVIYWSSRIGQDNVIFRMPKFRSMLEDTPAVATHLMIDAEKFLTPIGGVLRRYSLDELPQLFSVLRGDMSFVGPRPALFNQDDLIALRSENNLDKLIPGLTGWAQINGRDNLSISEKIELEIEYLHKRSFWFDCKILWLTFLKVISKTGVLH